MSQGYALALCKRMEEVGRPLGWHVALTGGCLYGEGKRKDVDVMFYKHDGTHWMDFEKIDVVKALSREGLFESGYGHDDGSFKTVLVGSSRGASGAEYRVDLFFVNKTT